MRPQMPVCLFCKNSQCHPLSATMVDLLALKGRKSTARFSIEAKTGAAVSAETHG